MQRLLRNQYSRLAKAIRQRRLARRHNLDLRRRSLRKPVCCKAAKMRIEDRSVHISGDSAESTGGEWQDNG